jgi:protein TonB
VAATSAPRPIPPAKGAPPAGPPAKAAPVYAIAMESPTDAASPVGVRQGGGGGGGSRPGGTGHPAGSGAGAGDPLAIKRMPEIDTDACGRSIAYPAAAERAGVEGKVRLRVALDAHGRVSSARVLRGLGYGLDQAAVDALTRRCRFTPAIASDGRPVPFVIESYTFAFELPR